MATCDNTGNAISGHSPLRFQDLSPNIQTQLRNITFAAHKLKTDPLGRMADMLIEGIVGSIEDIFQDLDPSPELQKAWRLEELLAMLGKGFPVNSLTFTREEVAEIAELLRGADRYKLGHP